MGLTFGRQNIKEKEQPQKVSLTVDINKYAKLISQINMMDNNDDGIKFNWKLKAIIEVWQNTCKTPIEVEESISCIYQECLTTNDFSDKVVSMVTANSFSRELICNIKMKTCFVSLVQSYYEKREALRLEDVNYFRRSFKTFGGIFRKVRMVNGKHIIFLAEACVDYLRLLLKHAEQEDLELFTTELYLSGFALTETIPDELKKIMADVRKILIYDTKATDQCKIWLLLAVEVFNLNFGRLPKPLVEFYQDKLGEEAMAHFHLR